MASKGKGDGEGEDEFFLEIRVHDPAKVGDGMGAYVSYKVIYLSFRDKHCSNLREAGWLVALR